MDKLVVKEVIGSTSASTPNKAKSFLNALRNAVTSKRTTLIDFSDLSIITTAFLNSSVGKLYSLCGVSDLNKYIKFDTSLLTPLQKERIRMVIENAKPKISQKEITEEID